MKNTAAILFVMFLLLFTVFSCKKKEPLQKPYLEFVSPSDEILLIGSKGSGSPDDIVINLETNRSVFIIVVDSVTNSKPHWISQFSYKIDNIVTLRITVNSTEIKRAARIVVTTLPSIKDAEPAVLSILVRQSGK